MTQDPATPLTDLVHGLDSLASAMRLCLACGFCCNGTLHLHTALLPDEAPTARALGLAVETSDGRSVFRQPCAQFRDGRCAIYERRPQVCRRYTCALLKKLLTGELSLEQSLRIVAIAQKQLAVFRARVPDAASFMRWLKEIEASADALDADPGPAQAVANDTALSDHTVALIVYLTKYFGENDADV